MKISEGLKKLQQFLSEHGDLEIASLVEVEGQFVFTQGLIFDIAEYPTDDETDFIKVCALMEPLNTNTPGLHLIN